MSKNLTLAGKVIFLIFSFLIFYAQKSTAQSLRFTDTSYVSLGNDASLHITNFTIEAWIKIEGYSSTTNTGTGGVSGVAPIVTKGRAEAENAAVDINYFLGYRLSDMKLIADFEDNATSLNHPVISNGTLTYCTWTHVAASYDVASHTWKLYINGALDKTLDLGSSFTPQSGSNVNACIGSSLNTGGSDRDGFFNGRIDEVRIWSLARTDAQILSNYNIELTSGTGLAGRWGLNEGTGTTAINSVVSGPAGTLTRNPLWVTGFNQVDPTTNSSLDFNGVHDFVTFGSAAGLNTASFTLEAWIKIEGTGVTVNTGTGGLDGVPIIAKGRGEAETPANLNMNYFFGVNTSNVLVADFEESTGPNHPVTGTNAITSNTWTHVAITYDVPSSVWNLYINGVLDKTLDIGTNISPVTTSIQHASVATAMNSTGIPLGFFNGKIDEVRIWNRALTQSEIQTNMNNELTSGSGLIGRWGFNENCNTTAGNSIGGGVTGSIRSDNISTHPTNGGPSWVSSGFNNQPPNQPTNPVPANNAQAPSTSPNICATVSDPNGGNLRVRFYGRPKPAGGSGKFTVILLPDTQYYTEEPQGNNGGNNFMFKSQTTWIADNRAAKNIVYVGQLGDCVENGDNPPGSDDEIEWKRSDTAIKTIESALLTGLPQGIPYGICVGNHDQTPNGNAAGTTTYYNQYFGSTRFTGRSYYGGHYGSNNDNFYDLFSASGIDFLIISLEYDLSATFSAPGGPLDWAEGLVQGNPTKKVIVLSHFVLDGTGAFSTQGQAIYDRLKIYSNFLLMIGGHNTVNTGEARRTDTYNGNTVTTILSDYQARTGGGNGLLRIYEFDPSLNQINVQTYSPYTSTFETDASSQFTLSMNMNTFSLIGETTAASGSVACFNWPGLSQFTDYEWYVELYDGDNTTTGPVWTFTTPANSPLPVTLVSFTANEENKKVRIAWSTVYERNNSHFEIERSKDGANFFKIAQLNGHGNSNSWQSYMLYDDQPFKGISYYRLKQVDIDGSFSYSRIVSVNISDKKNPVLIFPNPTYGNSFTISLSGNVTGNIDIRVYDINGSLKMKKRYPASNSIVVNHKLASGVYLVRIATKEITENRQLIVE